jgi:carbonic anhydrase/acetyltransferase-like protein (isoleucine patch superfamily)
MSSVIPASLKGGPVTTNTLAANRYILVYLLLFYLSLLPNFFLMAHFFYSFEENYYWILFMFPLQLFLWYIFFVLGSLFWPWVFINIVNIFHKPREGIFPRNRKNKDFRYWSLRAVIKKFSMWVCHTFPFPWMDIVAFKIFGNQVPLKTPMFDAWVDTEFLQIGDGSTIGQGSVVMTSMITTEFLIIKRVKIGKNCVIGAHSTVSPGTVIGDNVVLGALSGTTFGQVLEENFVYMGCPAAKFRESKFREEDELSSEDRAKIQEYENLITELPDGAELSGRKVIRLVTKSAKKDLKASKHLGLASYHQSKAEVSYNKEVLKAEKHERKAIKKKVESKLAIERAKIVIGSKKEKLEKKEEKDQEKEVKKLEKQEEKDIKKTAKEEKKSLKEEKKADNADKTQKSKSNNEQIDSDVEEDQK